jgi:protein-tyrosine phosphatase
MHIDSVLMVCTGNICRSPMAQGLLLAALPGMPVHSAGVAALVGHAAEPEAVRLLAELGIDLAPHRAQQLTLQLVERAGLILVAEQRHRRHIEQLYPFARGRVYRIAEHIQLDVPDPYQLDLGHYQHTLGILQEGVQHWVQRLRPTTTTTRQDA